MPKNGQKILPKFQKIFVQKLIFLMKNGATANGFF